MRTHRAVGSISTGGGDKYEYVCTHYCKFLWIRESNKKKWLQTKRSTIEVPIDYLSRYFVINAVRSILGVDQIFFVAEIDRLVFLFINCSYFL